VKQDLLKIYKSFEIFRNKDDGAIYRQMDRLQQRLIAGIKEIRPETWRIQGFK
jgi:hypothetical protein